jgi:hypothetical protein
MRSVQAAGKTFTDALSQTVAAWSEVVALADVDLLSKVNDTSAPPAAHAALTAAVANAPPTSITPSALPTPHLFPIVGASSGQSIKHFATANAGVVLGTSTQVSYVTQDELTAQIEQATNALRSLIYQNESVSNSLPASGGYSRRKTPPARWREDKEPILCRSQRRSECIQLLERIPIMWKRILRVGNNWSTLVR